jgi:predicted metalloprotease
MFYCQEDTTVDFVVFTFKDMKIITVARGEDFIETMVLQHVIGQIWHATCSLRPDVIFMHRLSATKAMLQPATCNQIWHAT